MLVEPRGDHYLCANARSLDFSTAVTWELYGPSFPFDFTRRRYGSRRCLTGSLATDTTLPLAASLRRVASRLGELSSRSVKKTRRLEPVDTSYPRARKGIWPVVGRIIGRISIGGEFGAHEVSTGVRRIKIQIHVRRQVYVEEHTSFQLLHELCMPFGQSTLRVVKSSYVDDDDVLCYEISELMWLMSAESKN